MPDIDGFKAVQTLRQQQSDLAVIFITAHEEYVFQAYNYQLFWFVSKNDLSILKDEIIKLLKKIEYKKRCIRAEKDFRRRGHTVY